MTFPAPMHDLQRSAAYILSAFDWPDNVVTHVVFDGLVPRKLHTRGYTVASRILRRWLARAESEGRLRSGQALIRVVDRESLYASAIRGLAPREPAEFVDIEQGRRHGSLGMGESSDPRLSARIAAEIAVLDRAALGE